MFVVDIEYLGAHPADNDDFFNTNRVTNAIKFTSPTIDGFTFGGMCSLSGVAGDVTRNQIWPLGGWYGGLDVDIAPVQLIHRGKHKTLSSTKR